VRELTWGDFSNDISYIKLSGFRNKSGRNRIVPVPGFVKLHLHPKGLNDNLFTGEHNSRNPDYSRHFGADIRNKLSYLNKGKLSTLLDTLEL